MIRLLGSNSVAQSNYLRGDLIGKVGNSKLSEIGPNELFAWLDIVLETVKTTRTIEKRMKIISLL